MCSDLTRGERVGVTGHCASSGSGRRCQLELSKCGQKLGVGNKTKPCRHRLVERGRYGRLERRLVSCIANNLVELRKRDVPPANRRRRQTNAARPSPTSSRTEGRICEILAVGGG